MIATSTVYRIRQLCADVQRLEAELTAKVLEAGALLAKCEGTADNWPEWLGRNIPLSQEDAERWMRPVMPS